MKRILRGIKHLNWKYIFGELLLIFFGITLAIWFNNWNTSVKSTRDKTVVVEKIKEEIQNNIDELLKARVINQLTIDAYHNFKKIYHENSSTVITSPQQFKVLRDKYPTFFRLEDSTAIEPNLFEYRGATFINLELMELSAIAWKTTQSISIANEFDYECLYQLESTYNLQEIVQKEIDRAASALQNRDIEKLMNILDFVSQLDLQLEDSYKKTLGRIDNCY